MAILDDIYRDRTNTLRKIHIVLNCFALLLFIAQGITGARDLLEIPPVGKKKAKKATVEMVALIETAQLIEQNATYYTPAIEP